MKRIQALYFGSGEFLNVYDYYTLQLQCLITCLYFRDVKVFWNKTLPFQSHFQGIIIKPCSVIFMCKQVVENPSFDCVTKFKTAL